MNLDRKFISKMLRIYGLVVVMANAIAVVVANLATIPFFEIESMQKWLAFLDNNKISNAALVFAFLVPAIVCIIYSKMIFKSEEKIAKNVAEIPSIFSLSSVIGWNLYYFIEIPFVIYAKVKLGIQVKSILISSWGYSLFTGMTAWTISYLLIELLNRSFMLPRIFPDGHIQHASFSFRPSFRHLMIFCFMVSSVFPIALLLTSLIAVCVNNGIAINSGIIIISGLILAFAFIITISLSKIILNPLNELTVTAEKIKAGDYKSRVPVVTADELGTLADSFNDMADSLLEKEFMRDTFGKVVDPEVRDYLMSGAGKASLGAALGGETREVTVLFCDIRSFTAMSEKMEAAEVVSLLNRYFTVLGKCIASHHGIINKYIGDAIMAIFGAPVESANSAQDAFNAVCDMRHALMELNCEFLAEGRPEVRFGIGIHTGPVFAGTIGAENRMEYTVIGDTVNTASRLESLCKTYKTDLLISAASAEKIAGSKPLTFVDNAQIRGKEEPMKVYTFVQ
ncbi:MAG: adenylate/guanylate cyclase domain-containing protein [Spirochaetaceae bacterium]|nr:adenylate/guanylate cyclase domain-containing protein [Spirochaetaceae bacterium]